MEELQFNSMLLVSGAFIPAHCSTQPRCSVGIRALSMGVKRPGYEAGHSSVFNAKVKNVWRYTSVPLSAFMACTAINARALFVRISLAVHRFITSALGGQINSVPLLKDMNLFRALVIVSLLQLQCATVFLFR